MIEYKSLKQSQIRGRGQVFTVINEKDRSRKGNDLLNQTVKIDGEEYVVLGVEYFLVDKIPKGVEIGLLVRKPLSR